MWGGRAVLHKVKTLQRMVGCAILAELGERVYAEKGKMMRREILWECGRSMGKQKSRNAVGLAGREGLIHWKNAMLATSSFHYVSQYIDKLMRQRK